MTSLGGQSLMRHIENEDLSAVINLLKTGAISLDERDENGQTFLMVGSRLGNLPIVRELLSHTEIDVNAVDNDNWTAMHNAAKEGHVEVVGELVNRGAWIEHRDMGGWTALMWACYKGHVEVVRELIDHDANVNVKGEHHMSCLTWAAGRGYLSIVQLLLSKDAKVNTADKYGTTPLIWAARKGHKEIVEALLEVGANVDNAGMNSWTALIIAAKGGYIEVVQNLLEHNPNVNAVDKDGYTALTLAAKDGHIDIVYQLLTKGAYVNMPDRYGDTILIHAVKGGHLEVAKALLKKYADIDVEGVDNKTALYWAVEKGHVSVAKTLLNYNADTEIPNKDGDTPLLKAVRNRSVELVEMLLNRSAKVSAMDKRGDTALTIAVRGRAKRITELLLRNPKDSCLLYKPNKSGQTPYQIDAAHQKSILNQIFGARHLNAEESIHGYDLYSSTIADVLSDPALKTPITVGLYAKWGSGKSFLIDKLQKEMKSFTQHSSDPVFEFSWLQFALCIILSLIVGVIFTFTLRWEVGLGVGLGLLFLQYLFLVLVWLGSHRRDWPWAERLSTYLAIKMQYLQLLLQVIFCNEPCALARDASTVRFLFTDNARLASVVGEKSITAMIGTLCDALEDEYGVLVTRLYRVFKPSRATQDQGRFKSICCIPYFVIVLAVILCIVAAGILIAIFGVGSITDGRYTAVDSALIAIAAVVGVIVISNTYTWGRVIINMVISPRRRVERIGSHMESLKVEGFMQSLKREVELLAQMTSCMDSFLGNSTRLVVIVDGLDSCEQDRLLTVLDTVHMLFGDMDSPFVTILAIDPHVIIKGIEHNLHGLFRDSSINGHDYLRNIVHLPFFLQSQSAPRSRSSDNNRKDTTENSHKFTRQESIMGSRSSLSSVGKSRHARGRHGGSMMGGSAMTRHGSNFDLTKSLVKNTYFSDINPRNMRRLMNIVGVTGRLLRAHQITFSWYRLAAWIYITEQWPYRLSWIIMEVEDSEDFENTFTLKNILESRVLPKMPVSKDIDPLLEIDRNPRKLEFFLANHQPLLNVGDLRKFLPCTINVDPYLRKLIREMMQNADNITSEYGFNPLQAPATVGQIDMSGLGGPPGSTGGAWSGTLRRPQSRIDQLAAHISPRATPTRFAAPRMGHTTPLPFGMTPQQNYQAHMAHMAAMSGTQIGASPYMVQYMGNQPTPGLPLTRSSPKIQLQGGDRDIVLSQLTVEGVCGLLDKLEGINKKKLPDYKERLTENNINGIVLLQCELHELKAELKMAFGDWELFRSLVEVLRDRELNTKMGRSGIAGKVMRTFDEEDDNGANSPHIRFTADVPPKEEKLEAPTPFYPCPSVMEQKGLGNVERTVSTEFPHSPSTESTKDMHQPGPSASSSATSNKSTPQTGQRKGSESMSASHRTLSQQSSVGSMRSLHDDFVNEFIFETQSIHDVMEDMGITDDESNDMEDTDPDSEVYDTVIRMPEERRPEIPATLLTQSATGKVTQLSSIGETSLSTPSEKNNMAKSPSEQARAKFIVSAAKEESLGIEMGELDRLKEKHASYVAAASNMAASQKSTSSSEAETAGAQSAPVRSPRYSSDSSSDGMATHLNVAAEINPTDGCFPDLEQGVDDVTAPLLMSSSSVAKKSSTPRTPAELASRERLGPRLMERLEKLSMDLEEDDPELSGLHSHAGSTTCSSGSSTGPRGIMGNTLGPMTTEKTPLMTPATSREHLNVRKANKVKDETGPSAFQVVTPGSSRASSLAASAASSRCGSLSGTPLPVSPAMLEGMDYFALEQRANWKKISPSSGLSRKGSTTSLSKERSNKAAAGSGTGATASSSGVGSPATAASPGTPKTIGTTFSGVSSAPASDTPGTAGPQPAKSTEGKEVIVNIDGKTVKMPLPKDESFL